MRRAWPRRIGCCAGRSRCRRPRIEMPKKKTWIWILVACGAVCIVGLLAMATAGVIFVSHHIQARTSTGADASRRFEAAKAPFKDQRPLFELDQRERVRLTRELS